MTFFDRIRNSLRVRLLLGLGVMLVPFVVLVLASYLASLNMISALEEVVRTETNELHPVTELQRTLLQTAMPPNDYLITGDRAERVLFDHLSQETEKRFDALITSKVFEEEDERSLIRAAYAEWTKARQLGAAILAQARPVGSIEGRKQMKVFDGHIDRAAEVLSRLYEAVLREVREKEAQARSVRRRESVLLAAFFCLALVIAVTAATFLSRSIVIPVRALQDGIFRFSQGDHSYRVSLDRADEFGQLAQTMNVMAERLEYDTLTGVYNRHEFHRRLKNEIERSLRYDRTFTLLMVDIDHFKKVNDTYGHPCGDETLRAVTMRLLKDLRSADSVARYGGEEFAVIMPETGAKAAMLVADRFRTSVAAQPVQTVQGQVVSVTVSIGLAVFPQDARSEDDLIAAADLALYAAKQRGRNRVVLFDPAMNSSGYPHPEA